MVITICGSLKFHDEILELEKALKRQGHTVYMPVKAPGVDYWAKSGGARVAAKASLGLINKHMDKIKQSDAILVANYTKKHIKNYVGANTFSEIIFAYYLGKKIYFVNSIPNQSYVIDELKTVQPVILNGNVEGIRQK